MDYIELERKQSKLRNEFYNENVINLWKYVIEPEKVSEELKNKGLTPQDLIKLYDNFYLKKEKLNDYNNLMEQLKEERHEYIINNIYEVAKYEFGNYEAAINYDLGYTGVLTEIMELSKDEIEKYKPEILQAAKDYKKEYGYV